MLTAYQSGFVLTQRIYPIVVKKIPQNNCSSVTSVLLHILTVVGDWGLGAAAVAVTGLEES